MTNPYRQGSVSPLPPGGDQPAAQYYKPPRIFPTGRFPLVMGAVAAFLLVAAIVVGVAGSGFPDNAPVEQIFMFGIVIDLVAASIALGICAIVFARRRSATPSAPRPIDVFPLMGALFAAVTFVAWLLLGGTDMFLTAVAGGRLRYMNVVLGTFLAGIPWALAFVFGAIGIRRQQSAASRVLALAALILAALVVIPTTAATIIYGLGLSD